MEADDQTDVCITIGDASIRAVGPAGTVENLVDCFLDAVETAGKPEAKQPEPSGPVASWGLECTCPGVPEFLAPGQSVTVEVHPNCLKHARLLKRGMKTFIYTSPKADVDLAEEPA